MRIPALIALATLSIASTGCGDAAGADGAGDDPSEDALINGTPTPPTGVFTAIVRISGNCTATQIGPRLLVTAAHCVEARGGALDPAYAAGRELPIGVRSPLGYLADASAKIRETVIHPVRAALCAQRDCQGGEDAPDVAFVKLEQNPKDVGVLPVSTVQSRPGEDVIALGFGCIDALSGMSDTLLRQGTLTVLDPMFSTSADRPADARSEDLARSVFLVTAGPAYRPGSSAPGVCSGDSGGPVLRASTSKPGSYVLVAVNSFVRNERRSEPKVPTTNWHARVDVFARHHVFQWLEQAGAKFAH